MFTIKAFEYADGSPSEILEAESIRTRCNNTQKIVDEVELITRGRGVIILELGGALNSNTVQFKRVTVENSEGRRVEDFRYCGDQALVWNGTSRTPPTASEA